MASGEVVSRVQLSDTVEAYVGVGTYLLGIGPPAGMSISVDGLTRRAGADLCRAVAREKKDGKRYRRPVDDLDVGSIRPEHVTEELERADRKWLEVANEHLDVAAVTEVADALLDLKQGLEQEGRLKEGLRVARSLSRLLALAERWVELLRTLRRAHAVAACTGDLPAQAWASHELGTLYIAGNNLVRADEALSEAIALRRELGDIRGRAAAERNLHVLCQALRADMRDGRLVRRSPLRRLEPRSS